MAALTRLDAILSDVRVPSSGHRITTCAELLARLEQAGVALAAPGAETEALLVESRVPGELVPLRFEMRIEERPFLTFRRADGGELTWPLDRRVADHLATRFGSSPIDTPELLLAGAPNGSTGAGTALSDAAEALRALECDDLRVRRLEILRAALLGADLGSVDATLSALLRALLDLTGAERGAVFLIADGKPEVRLHVDREGREEHPVLPSRVLARALERGVVFTSDDVADDAELYHDTVEELRIKSLLVAPLLRDGAVAALVYLDRRLSATRFSDEIVTLFGELAGDLWHLLDAALERERLAHRVERLEAAEPVGEFRSAGAATRAILGRVRQAARTRQPILLLGESGTGKTLLAEGIHQASAVARGPFVRVRVPEIAENLFESEMFGHERGAFTGAVAARRGLLQEADGGTLFLDEAGRLSPAMQAKLLGALEGDSAAFRRVGGGELRSRFRLVAATSIDLEQEVEAGRFLPDLWWRLAAGLVVRIPPLRERVEDVPMLAELMLRQISVAEGQAPARFAAEALADLSRAPWPGNVRELRAAVQRGYWAAQARSADPVTVERGDLDLKPAKAARAEPGDAFDHALEVAGYRWPEGDGLNEQLEFLRAARIRRALDGCGHNEAEAARRLGFRSPSTFRSQLQRLGIKVERRTASSEPD